MAKSVFKIDGVEFPHIRVLSLKQSFQVLDGVNSGRVLTGEMRRDIIGTYFNYTLVLKPEYSKQGMQEYAKLFHMCSSPVDFHRIEIPFDVGESETHIGTDKVKTNPQEYLAYITSGEREMLKYDIQNTDMWKEATFQFVAMSPTMYA